LPGGQPFDAVLDAIQGDGFNPLWREVQITFNPGVTPHQLTRDDDILDAAAPGEITLSSEGEVYRCSVVGATTSISATASSARPFSQQKTCCFAAGRSGGFVEEQKLGRRHRPLL